MENVGYVFVLRQLHVNIGVAFGHTVNGQYLCGMDDIKKNTTPVRREKRSAALFKKAKTYFPGGVNSPVRAFRSVGGTPVFIKKGNGSHITDEDGQTYIDFCNSWGPLILGHNHPNVRRAIVRAVGNGTSFGAPTALENKLADLILRNNRFIEKIRFTSSGTEAVMSALRLARGATGRNKIIKFEGCYHGHVDALLVKAGSGLVTFGESTSAGVPKAYAQETLVLPLNRPDLLDMTLAEHGHDIACIIIEPVPANNGLLLQDRTFLQYLRDKCTAYGILLIFDEVISGFRVGIEGAAGIYDIRPDIITYGKIIGGGMPVGAYGASHKIMSNVSPEGPVYQAGTLSGNPVAMAAGHAALTELLKPGFYEYLDERAEQLTSRLNAFCKQRNFPAQFPRIGSIFWLSFSVERIISADQIDDQKMDYFRTFYHTLLANGVYMGPSGYEVGFISAAHTIVDIDTAAAAFEIALEAAFG